MPGDTALASSSAVQLVRRMQPCDWVLPIVLGSGVPWMPRFFLDKSIQATPTGLFGPAGILALLWPGSASQNSLGHIFSIAASREALTRFF